MIRDETKGVRKPAAWLLLGGVGISVFVGIVGMLSNSWAVAANPGELGLLFTGGSAGPTFADRAALVSHLFTAVPVTAMAVVAVILATHVGEKLPQARTITRTAVALQGAALLLGVVTWLVSIGAPPGGGLKLAFVVSGAAGVLVAVAGLYFSVVTMRSTELQAPAARATAQQAPVYPGYGYQAGQGYQAGGYQPVSPQPAAAQQPSSPAQYQGATQQYGAAGQQYGQPQAQAQAAYGQQSYGSYGQQYPAGYSQGGYQQGYEGYGQTQSYGQGYSSSSYSQQGYGQPQSSADSYQRSADGYQQPGADASYPRPPADAYQQPAGDTYQRAEGYQQPGAEGYQQPGAEGYQQPGAEGYQQPGADSYQAGSDSYQQYYQQAQQPAEHGAADDSRPGRGADEGDSRDL